MFKIVQTLERGKKELTIVPSAWERSGVLFWPKSRADKLIKINSMPESNWFEMTCVLKRSKLLDLESAEKELEKMLRHYDTEEETPKFQYTTVPEKKSRVRIPRRTENAFNVNDLVEQTITENQETPPTSVMNDLSESTKNIYIQDSRILNPDPEGFITLDQNNIEFGNSVLFDEDKINDLFTQLNLLKENQEKIMYALARFETSFEIIVSKTKRSQTCSCSGKDTNKKVNPLMAIVNLDDMDKLEDDLKNRILFDEYVDRMSTICGKSGKGKGVDICYILVDIFFDRKFLINCSWAGGSREKNKEKIPFKIYKNVINLFFEIVHLGDNDFTLEQCHEFFKNIIRNAVKRSESSVLRTSRSKRRPSKLCYKKKSSPQIITHSSINEDFGLIDTNGNDVGTENLLDMIHDEINENSS